MSNVEGNYIGTNSVGATGLGNQEGVQVDSGAADSTIIGNVISGNALSAIFFDAGVAFQGNIVGLSPDETTALPNVSLPTVWSTASSLPGTLLIGGPDPSDGNIIAGNTGNTVQISSPVTIQNNIIGTNSFNDAGLGNTRNGVLLNNGASGSLIADNIIAENGEEGITIAIDDTIIRNNIVRNNSNEGIEADGEDNLITENVVTGNGDDGIRIDNGTAVVSHNYVGTDAAGTTGLGNTNLGILVDTGITSATITDNTVASNNSGVRATATCIVTNNIIGTNAAGTLGLGHNFDGVIVTEDGAGTIVSENTIAGNTRIGVFLNVSGTVDNNYIGTNASFATDLGNIDRGIYVQVGITESVISNNTICNNGAGVTAFGATTIRDNFVGTNALGDTGLGNDSTGIYNDNDADGSIIENNIIASNGQDGIWLDGDALMRNNIIGTESTQTVAMGNGRHGIFLIDNSAANSTIEENVIVNSVNRGISMNTVSIIRSKTIGTDSVSEAMDWGNGEEGIYISGNGSGSEVASNLVVNSVEFGISVGADVTITSNTLTNNFGGVELRDGSSGSLVGGPGNGSNFLNHTSDHLFIADTSTSNTISANSMDAATSVPI